MPRKTPLASIVGLILVLVSLCPGQTQQQAVTPEKPIITDFRIVSLTPSTADDQMMFELVIEGDNLSSTKDQPTVILDTKDPTSPVRNVSALTSDKREVRVKGSAKVGTEIIRVVVFVGAEKAETTKGFILKTPKITNVRIVSLPPTNDDKVTFVLGIEGENLPGANSKAKVMFYTTDPASPVINSDIIFSDKELLVKVTARVGTEIERMEFLVEDKVFVKTEEGLKVSIKANPDEKKVKQFEVKFEHQKNKEFPNLHSLLITKESGPDDAGFEANPHRMTVDLVPTGATDLNIVQSNKQRLDLHFVAAADYEPKSVVITVYDGSDLDRRAPIATSIDKKPEDPDQPKITGTEIVFIEREQGIGRIRIYGKGFGDYVSPPYPVDDYLWNCLKRFRTEPVDEELQGKKQVRAKARQKKDFNRDKTRLDACVQLLGEGQKPVESNVTLNENKLQGRYPLSFVEKIAENKRWKDEGEVRKNVTVAINPRNPDIRVEKAEILNINDKMIDVYFEFESYRGYALPFRLADATVTIKKRVQKTQEIKNDKVTATVAGLKEQTYSVPYQPGPKRDSNLSYKYTVLDKDSANTLVGRGIAENFFVLQLSVVNNGEKKITIPLSAIQAEVEWAASAFEKKEFRVGPPTLPPVPLAAVSGYFDAYQKVQGTRAQLFNILDAATIVATGLVPFTGPSFKDAALYFSGAAVPAARKAWGDLSGQQLQNLTALSWESSETVSAKGGSTEKLIYIPMGKEFVGKVEEEEGIKKEVWKQVTNITDIEVTGYEVLESEPKQATSSGTSSATASAPSSSSSQTPTTPTATPSEPATSPQPEPTQKKK